MSVGPTRIEIPARVEFHCDDCDHFRCAYPFRCAAFSADHPNPPSAYNRTTPEWCPWLEKP